MSSSSFFSEPKEIIHKADHFFKNFPPQEIWRFFIDKELYDDRKGFYNEFLDPIYELNLEILKQQMMKAQHQPKEYEEDDEETKIQSSDEEEEEEEIEVSKETLNQLLHKSANWLNQATIADLKKLALHSEQLESILKKYNLTDKDSLKFSDCVQEEVVWLGFERRENGYLEGVINAFAYILDNLKNKLDIAHIKKIHQTATQHVSGLLNGTVAGEFRNSGVGWTLTDAGTSKEGLREILDYLIKNNHQGFFIRTANDDYFIDENVVVNDDLIDGFWNMMQQEETKIAIYESDDKAFVQQNLEKVSQELLDIFLKEISEPNLTKEEKLHAIFKFVKFSELHHPFKDGTGRTYAMLLLQDLLLRYDLFPVILDDTNIIPGFSVNEMVKIYLTKEKEMIKGCQQPEFFSSPEFAKDNINTSDFIAHLPPAQKAYIENTLEIYKNKINSFKIAYD